MPTDQNSEPPEIEGKVNVTFLINKEKRRWYSIEPDSTASKFVTKNGLK